MSLKARRILPLMIILAGLGALGCSTQKTKPKVVGFAIFPPLQYPPSDVKIEANRTSILWGRHDEVHGIDAGLVGNIVDKHFAGSSLSLGFHATRGTSHVIGAQLAGVTNMHLGKSRLEGFQIALGFNYSGAEHSVIGVQAAGLGNFGGKTTIYGIQLGLYNESEAVYGFQIGLINRTRNLHGIQIGALNFSAKNGLPFLPVINIGF